jgi:hypothetical protein
VELDELIERSDLVIEATSQEAPPYPSRGSVCGGAGH